VILRRLALRLGLAALLLGGAALCAAMQRPDPDPYVLLDAAKQMLGKGRLAQAKQMLAEIPLGQAEPFVDEEIVFERLLASSADLVSVHALYQALEKQNLGETAYAKWLKEEHARRAQDFGALAADYLARTAHGCALDFVRFRLPVVSDEHLQDVLLFTDPVMLSAACKNWDDGRDGLGRGLAESQARVALVLAAALNYDLPHASATVEQVAQRLRAGVPLDPATVLDWLADTAAQCSLPGDGLSEVSAQADARLLTLIQGEPQHPLLKRAAGRGHAPAPGTPGPAAGGARENTARQEASKQS
jgi:hypothetical protein